MDSIDTQPATFDLPAVAQRFAQVQVVTEDALAHMNTSLELAEAQLAVVRHHHTHRLAQDVANT